MRYPHSAATFLCSGLSREKPGVTGGVAPGCVISIATAPVVSYLPVALAEKLLDQ